MSPDEQVRGPYASGRYLTSGPSRLMLLAGGAAFIRGPRVHASDFVGIALVVLGYALRPESGQVAFVLFSPFALWVLAADGNVASILRMLAAMLGVVLCVVVGQVAYRSTPGWETYPDYLSAGRQSLDYSDLSVEEVRSIAPELSEEDIALLHEWMFIDEDVFGIDFFSRYGEAREHISLDNVRDALGAGTTYALLGLAVTMALFAMVVTGDIGRGRGVRLLASGVVLMLLVSCALLILRVRVHVVIPLVFCTLMSLSMCAHAPAASSIGAHVGVSEGRGPHGGWVASLLVLTICASVVSCFGFWAVVVRLLRSQSDAPVVDAVADYVEGHPDELVVFARTQTLLYSPVRRLLI